MAPTIATVYPDDDIMGVAEGVWVRYLGRCRSRGQEPTERVILVAGVAGIQCEVVLVVAGRAVWRRPASPSLRPPCQREGSHGTPLGLHRVTEKIGDGQPPGTIFRARQPTGVVWSPDPAAPNLITTRILRLAGLEPGWNAGGAVDTLARYVYLHGTNHPGRLGRPASAGCIQLADADILDLFPRLVPGDHVFLA